MAGVVITVPVPSDDFNSGATDATLIMQEVDDALVARTQHVFVSVASQAAMLALAANVGDLALRSDVPQVYALRAAPATVLGNWALLPTSLPTPIGANGTVLTANSGAGGGADWEAPATVGLSNSAPTIEAFGDNVGTGGAAASASRSDHQHGISQLSAIAGLSFTSPAVGIFPAGICQFPCTLTSIVGYRLAGTGLTVNVAKGTNGSPLKGKAADLSITSSDTWMSANADQNQSYIAGDPLYIMVQSLAGAPTQVAVQANFSVP